MVRRWFALLGASFVGALGVTVGLVAGPVPHAAALAPVPTIPVPPSVAGAVGGTTTVAGGAVTVGLTLAGAGAFEGTCYVLGQMFNDPDGCDDGAKGLINLVFGGGGDDRSVPRYGSVGSVSFTYPGPGTAFSASFDPNDAAAPSRLRVRVFYYTSATSTDVCDQFNGNALVFTGTGPVALSLPAFGTCSGTNTGSIASISFYDFNDAQQSSPATGGFIFTNGYYWSADRGLGKAWNLEYRQVCQKGSEVVATTDQITYVPLPSGTAPQPNLPACSTVLPGSHVKEIGVKGGRDSISNPEVNVVYPTFTGAAETAYPLCTTNAPVGGCFMDLQRNGQSCFSGGVYCAGWPANVSRWNMTCEWGPYLMPISDCTAKYGTSFDLQTQPNPSSTPSATPAPPIQPLPTEGPNPTSPPTQPDVNTDPDSQNCWGQGWSWNPVSWVYVPVKCALSWAFIPNEWPDFGSLSSPLPPGWIPSLPNISAGACGPITIGSLDFVLARSNPQTLVNTCDDPWPTVRNVTYYGVLTLGLMTLGQRAFRATLVALGMAVEYGAAAPPDGGKP